MEPFTFNVATGGNSQVNEVVLGGALALAGGIATNLVTAWLHSRRVNKSVNVAIQSELKPIREDLSTSIMGYRDSLKVGSHPSPTVFAFQTPIFSAILPMIGEVKDIDLIQHILEAYGTLHELKRKTEQPLTRSTRDENQWLVDASGAFLLVMTLHNRLSERPNDQTSGSDEADIYRYKTAAARLTLLGLHDFVLDRDWKIEDVTTVLVDRLKSP